MKDTLRTRLEFLWAKLAGRDVDIDTMTPDAPTNMVEKLMIETANRIADAEQGGGGSSDKYVVRFTPSGDTYVPDRTFAQIEAAVNANKTVVGTVDGMGFVDLVICNQSYGAVFQSLAPFESDYATLYILDITPNDQTYIVTHEIPYLPSEPVFPFWVNYNEVDGVFTLDKTFEEIRFKLNDGYQVYVLNDSGPNQGCICVSGCYVGVANNNYTYDVVLPFFPPATNQYDLPIAFTTDSSDGYPSYSNNGPTVA